MSRRSGRFRFACVAAGIIALAPMVAAQQIGRAADAQSTQAPPKDVLGRDTPRGTVLGFMNAARGGRDEVATQYLNTRLRDQSAIELARQLFAVLDKRLPARLGELSDRPEGSMANPLKPDQDVVATITSGDGTLDVVLERTNRSGSSPVWLFSRQTLDAIPDVYADINLVAVDQFMPAFLTKPRLGGVRLFDWLTLFLAVPLGYRLLGLLGRPLSPLVISWRRRLGYTLPVNVVPGFARLLILAVAIRWLLGMVELPLLERMFWSSISATLAIVAVVWALLRLNGIGEAYAFRHLRNTGHAEIAAILRLARRIADAIVISLGVVVMLRHAGMDPTAALAGLGIGGVAVALAAQKTLENVIGGVSIIFDKAVRVGDFLKLGDTSGTVESIGLRSTRIRTLDRTMLSVPNSQIANANIETISVRDKFWFHHFVALGYETTSAQVRSVVDGTRTYLAAHPMVDANEPVRVRFFRFGQFSLDIELFAYLTAADWERFLEAQQELLLGVMEIVEGAGAAIALPSHTLRVAAGRLGEEDDPTGASGRKPELAGRIRARPGREPGR